MNVAFSSCPLLQPAKKLRKNKSFADGIMEVALDTKKAVRHAAGCSWVLGRSQLRAADTVRLRQLGPALDAELLALSEIFS